MMPDCVATASTYVFCTGRAGDAWQQKAGSPMAILQLGKLVVFKKESKRSKEKQYKSKFRSTVGCKREG
jgi:hypothetical protein